MRNFWRYRLYLSSSRSIKIALARPEARRGAEPQLRTLRAGQLSITRALRASWSEQGEGSLKGDRCSIRLEAPSHHSTA